MVTPYLTVHLGHGVVRKVHPQPEPLPAGQDRLVLFVAQVEEDSGSVNLTVLHKLAAALFSSGTSALLLNTGTYQHNTLQLP